MIAVLEKPSTGTSKKVAPMSEPKSVPGLAALSQEQLKNLIYLMWFYAAHTLYLRWAEMIDDKERLWKPGITIDGFVLLSLRLTTAIEAENRALRAAGDWLEEHTEPKNKNVVDQAAKLASQVFLEEIKHESLQLSEIEEFLGLKTYAGTLEESISKLSSNQRNILVSIFRKSAEYGHDQPIKWVSAEEFPEISPASISRSLRHLEERELIQRLPKRYLKITALGWQVAKQLNLFPRS